MSNNCKRCGRILKSQESIKRGMGKVCYRITQFQKEEQPEQLNNSILEELLDRVRKLELDNNFMKHQLKHKTIISKSKDSEIDWDIKPEIKKAINESEIKFNFVVKELKVIFTKDFNYRDVLKSVNPIEIPIAPPMMVGVLT